MAQADILMRKKRVADRIVRFIAVAIFFPLAIALINGFAQISDILAVFLAVLLILFTLLFLGGLVPKRKISRALTSEWPVPKRAPVRRFESDPDDDIPMAKLATPLQVQLDYGTRDYERERQGSRFGLRVAAVLCGMNILTMALALLRAFAGQIEMEMFFGFAALLLFPTGIIAALVGLALHFTSNKAARMSGLAALFVITLFFDGGLLLMIIIQAR